MTNAADPLARVRAQTLRRMVLLSLGLWTFATAFLVLRSLAQGASGDTAPHFVVLAICAAALVLGHAGQQWQWAFTLFALPSFGVYAFVMLSRESLTGPCAWWMGAIVVVAYQVGVYRTANTLLVAMGVVLTLSALLSPAAVVTSSPPWSNFELSYAIFCVNAICGIVMLLSARWRSAQVERLENARMEAESNALAKVTLLANASHEIRTPLNALTGAIELLGSSKLSPDQRHELSVLQQRSAQALLSLVNDILDFSKLDSGRLELERVPFHLRRLIFESNQLFSVPAFAKGIEVTSSADALVAPVVLGDPTRLRQALNNLISNAVKFTAAGGVHIHVGLAKERRPPPSSRGSGQWVRLEVSDTGSGIPAEHLPRLFEPYSQARSDISRRYGGTGLGLAITRRIVEAMGGSLGVRSELKRGTTFGIDVWFDVPPSQGHSESTPRLSRPVRVAVVSAQPGLQRHIGTLLLEIGAQYIPFETFPESLSSFADVEVVLLDRQVAQVQSLPFATELRSSGVAAIELAPLNEVSSCLHCTDLLYKPVRRSSLHAVIERAVGQDRARSEITPEASALCETAPIHPYSRGRVALNVNVLACEDDEVSSVVLQTMLEELGARCTVARTGEDAVEAWWSAVSAGDPFHVVLMDRDMPRLNGIEATRRILLQAAEHGISAPCIVATTGSVDEGEVHEFLRAGAEAVLHKPFSLLELRARLSSTSTSKFGELL